MNRDEAIALFGALTGASEHVASHVLEAHGWSADSAVSWYLESGGVGFGAAATPAAPPDFIEEPDDVVLQPRPNSRPLLATRRRTDPIEILDDDDDDVQVLASSLGRRRGSRVEEVVEDDLMHPVGSVEDELELGSQARRVRRNRRRVAGGVDRDLELLGQRFGVMAEFQPAPTAQQRQQPGPGQGPAFVGDAGGAAFGGPADVAAFPGDADVADLPPDVDLEEQRMLMAAIQGGGYEGELPDFQADPRYQPRVLSPGAAARQELREEQDAAYHASLRADREKQEAAEQSRREAEEAAQQQAQAAEAEAQRQREEAERLERNLASKAAGLPAEPGAEDPDAVNLAIRLPEGGRYSRRFRRSDKLQAVFDFVDVQSGVGGAVAPGSYCLATSYPRRLLHDGAAGQSLAEAGLCTKQEALFLELK